MPKAKAPGSTLSAETCKQITDLVLDFLAGKLGPTVNQRFKKHLRICPDCVSFMKTYKKTVQATGSLPVAQIPAKVRDNILAFLRNKVRRVGAVIVYYIAQLIA
jgi:hypothetical protein